MRRGIRGRGWMRTLSENHDSFHIHVMIHYFCIFESYYCHVSLITYWSLSSFPPHSTSSEPKHPIDPKSPLFPFLSCPLL